MIVMVLIGQLTTIMIGSVSHNDDDDVDCTNGDVNESFYLSIENAYSNALDIIEKSGLMASFKPRAQKIVADSTDIGWGFHDCLSDLFYQYFEPV